MTDIWEMNTYFKKFKVEDSMYNNYKDNIVILSIHMLYLFKKLLKYYDPIIVDDFINLTNHFRQAMSFIEKHNSFSDDFIKKFENNIIKSTEKLGITPSYSWKFWGAYLIVLKQSESRETIHKTIKDLKQQYPNVALEYASWRDGSPDDWICVEQYISKWIYSKYFDKSYLILETNKWVKMLWNHQELLWKIKEWIIVDQTSRKIYVNWKKLTSKDIPSQATTADVLSILIENIWKEVCNNVFDVSSYSKNKNDMIWKIVIPLVKLTKKYFNKEIEITCKWSLVEFYMILQEENIEIGVIKNVFND